MKNPKKIKQNSRKPKQYRIMNKGLQIYLLKKYFINAGFKGDLDKLNIKEDVDPREDFEFNRNYFQQRAIDEHLVADDGRQASDVFADYRELDDQVEKHEKDKKLEDLLEELRNKFNDEEGFEIEKQDFEDILFTNLITSNTVNLGAQIANEQPFIPLTDYSKIKELIDLLKSKKKPEEPSTGRSLNINS